jgi:hypothetical protein
VANAGATLVSRVPKAGKVLVPWLERCIFAQAQSNRALRGRKKDFADAERLLKRLVA